MSLNHNKSDLLMASCILPTNNRRQFVPQAIHYFLNQDYACRELIIVDDGRDCIKDLIPEDQRIHYTRLDQHQSLGAKRNLACEQAKGEVIVHWDDDDWMASWRLSYQLKQLRLANAEICGLNKLFYFDPWSSQAWEYFYPQQLAPLLAGGSLCYHKRVWQQQSFSDIDLGEDTAFIRAHKDRSILALEDNRFYAALNHEHNTNPRNTAGHAWRSRPYKKILAMLGQEQDFYINLVNNKEGCKTEIRKNISSSDKNATQCRPLVSCIMMTRDRSAWVSQAIAYFLRQDYPDKELLIVDDGIQSVQELVPDNPAVSYIRLDQPMSLGQKRNLAVKESHGGFIAHWDDDDWYAPNRIQSQLTALLSAKAKICGLYGGLIYDIERDRYWTVRPELHRKMYFADIHGRSIMYSRDVWENYAHYPDRSLGEDAGFLKNALARGASLVRLENDGLFIYIRHGQNTWEFSCGSFIDPTGWQAAAVPNYLSAEELDFYRQQHTTLLTSDLLTSPAHLPQSSAKQLSACHVTVSIPYHDCAGTLRRAVDSILNQTHKDLTLIVINDGDVSPWDLLEDIDDSRLLCFDMTANHGRYFADAVVLNAIQSPYFLVQDADDWSEPERIAVLLRQLRTDHAVGAISAEYVHHAERKTKAASIEHYHSMNEALSATFRHRANHHGLYRTAALRRIGGYYGGFRMGYDTLLVNLLQMTGRLAYVERPCYHRMIRSDSLSNTAATGMQSRSRQEVIKSLGRVYSETFRAYQDYVCGELDYSRLCRFIRKSCRQHILPEEQKDLDVETDRLLRQLQLGGAAKPSSVNSFQGNTATSVADDPLITWSDWSVDKTFARQMISTLEIQAPEHMLEVGAGATTFLLAEFAARTGTHFVSLEHDESYYQKVKSLLNELDLLKYVDLRLAPLEAYRCANGQDYPWYKTEFTGQFDFVLLGGPPERYGRQAGLFALQPCLADNWSIWLHDGNQTHKKACLTLWREHYSFFSTLSQADTKGLFCLNSPEGTAALVPQYTNYPSGIGIALLTGDRPELLRQTVESFSKRYLDILQSSTVVAMVNGRDHEAESYLQGLAFVDCILCYPHKVLSIGIATAYLAKTLARCKGVEYIFHLEDDWLSCIDHADWLTQAQDILQAYPEIGQVRIRHQSESVLSTDMVTQEPIRWVQESGFRVSPEAHFTFNPNLMRVADLDKVYPAETEYDAQLKFHQAGFSAAQLLPGCFQHIGTRQSRRIRLASRTVCVR